MHARSVLLALAPALGLAACATSGSAPTAEVIRYHLPGTLDRGTVRVEPAQPGLSGQPFELAVASQLAGAGYPAATPAAPTQFIAVVDTRRQDRVGPDRPPAFSIGLGGGGFSGGRRGGGVGLGGGIGIPIGRNRPSTLVGTELNVLIKRASDQTTVWEGHATTVTDTRRAGTNADAIAQKLATALFTGFPGESGRTISVK